MTSLSDRDALIAALAWQVELGADECIGETFLDRTEPLAEPPGPPPSRNTRSAPALVSARDEPASTAALAESASDLMSLRDAVAAFAHPLREGARNCVFADGNPAARVMIVGEGPGRDEDIQGLPFVGRSGQLLDRMLTCIGLDRRAEAAARAVYISNVLPWRPVGNRTPTPDEAQTFLPFLDRHIALADPEILVTMGNASTKVLLSTSEGIMRLRGRWTETMAGGRLRPVLPMLHPAYLLRQPAEKAKAWRDLLALESRLDGRKT